MTFAKKMITCGVYHRPELAMVTGGRHFNTWMGDPLRAHMTATQNEVIREDNLIEQAVTSGAYLHDRMLEMHEKYPDAVGSPRAKGLIQAWDC